MKISRYLSESPLFHSWRSFHSLKRFLEKDELLRSLGLLPSFVLSALYLEHPTPLSPGLLAKHFDTSKTSMSHVLSALEKKRLIRRSLHINDARSYQIVLSSEGQKKAQRLVKTFDQIQRKIEKRLGEKQSLLLVSTLRQLIDLV